MPAPAASRPRSQRRAYLAPLVLVTLAALVFAVLLVAVRLRWAPLESVDRGAAAHHRGRLRRHGLHRRRAALPQKRRLKARPTTR